MKSTKIVSIIIPPGGTLGDSIVKKCLAKVHVCFILHYLSTQAMGLYIYDLFYCTYDSMRDTPK